MIKAVIFDAQGMTIKGKMLSDYLIEKYGINRDRIQLFFQNEFLNCMRGKADLKFELQKLLADKDISSEVVLDRFYQEETKRDDRFIELINKLRSKGILCVLATNHDKYRLEFIKSNLGFGELFDLIIASCDIGYIKSEIGFFKYLLKKLNKFEKEEIIYWDDRESNIALAKSCGLKTARYYNLIKFKNKIKLT